MTRRIVWRVTLCGNQAGDNMARRPTDWLATQVEKLHCRRRQRLVEQAHYVQGGKAVDIWVTPMRAGASSDSDTGVIFNDNSQDFIADPAEFRAKSLLEPERGDRIIRQVNGERIEYQVIGTGSEPAFRYSSRCRLSWRIHTLMLRWEYNLAVRPCPAVAAIGATLGAVSIGWRTDPAVAAASTEGPVVVIG